MCKIKGTAGFHSGVLAAYIQEVTNINHIATAGIV